MISCTTGALSVRCCGENDEAKSLLTRYLAQSNSVRGDIHKRDKARQEFSR